MATTTKKEKQTTSSVHKYVSTTPVNNLPSYNQKEYHWSDYNKNMPGQYERKEYHWGDYNKGMPDAYKANTYNAQKYNGPGYNAQQYVSNYKPTEFTDTYNPGQYQSKYMPQIEQQLNNVTNWKYDPMQDASYQALAAVYGARGNLAAKNSLADAAMLNGGYGTSNAVSAAQQARNQYNQELASYIPQLEQAAYQRAQGNLDALMGMDNTLYGRFSDDQSRQLAAKQFGLDVAGYNEGNRQFAEQNAQNVWGMNNDERYRAVQNALDIFNTNTANEQWAAGMNQAEKAKAYDSLWDRYSTDLANRQWVSQMNQAERNRAYDSLWDVYNAQNANKQWVSGMNQNERQFGYNAGMDAAQLLNDYYQWAQNYNSGLYEWNKAQEEKAKSGGGGGGSRKGGGGGGYTGGSSGGNNSGGGTPTYEDAKQSYIMGSGQNEKNTRGARGLTTIKEKNKKSGVRLVK